MSIRGIKSDIPQNNVNLDERRKLENKDGVRGIRPDIKAEEVSARKLKDDLKVALRKKQEEEDDDPYDLDLQITDISSNALPTESAQSEWPRCSRVCQTLRGATCPNCDTQQARYTCIRC